MKILGKGNINRHSDTDIHGIDSNIGTLKGRDYKDPKRIAIPIILRGGMAK